MRRRGPWAAAEAIDSSRQLAGKMAGRIGETAREVRDSAANFAQTSAGSFGDATDEAQRRMGRLARATRRRVEDEPVMSVLIAVAVGAAAAALVLAIVRSQRAPA